MGKGQKFYVVWKGRQPGIYANWAQCETQVKGFPDAQFKAFATRAEAEEALAGQYDDYKGQPTINQQRLLQVGPPVVPSYSVDAACSGYPGPVEYRCVKTDTREEIFRQGPYANGTNNIGEFLAIVHALALFTKKNIALPLYSDSELAIEWVKTKQCRTNLAQDSRNAELFDLIARAEKWLKENTYTIPVLKWNTEAWGENPADFGRK